MDFAIRALGVIMLAIPAIDLAREMFQPGARWQLSGLVARVTWSVMAAPARRSRRVAEAAGAVIMALSVAAWVGLATIGWALVYLPSIQDNFSGHNGSPDIVDALYVSMVTVSTLGFGDYVPTSDWLRLAVPIEALFGLGLAAGTVSWLLSVHPILGHRKALATRISLLETAQQSTGISLDDIPQADAVLRAITTDLTTVHGDLQRYPTSYYFFVGERHRSLPANIHLLVDLAERLRTNSPDPLTRLEAEMLHVETERLLRMVGNRFLRLGDDATTQERIDAWHHDHHVAHLN